MPLFLAAEIPRVGHVHEDEEELDKRGPFVQLRVPAGKGAAVGETQPLSVVFRTAIAAAGQEGHRSCRSPLLGGGVIS